VEEGRVNVVGSTKHRNSYADPEELGKGNVWVGGESQCYNGAEHSRFPPTVMFTYILHNVSLTPNIKPYV
jgi:hypothetical protein